MVTSTVTSRDLCGSVIYSSGLLHIVFVENTLKTYTKHIPWKLSAARSLLGSQGRPQPHDVIVHFRVTEDDIARRKQRTPSEGREDVKDNDVELDWGPSHPYASLGTQINTSGVM